MDSSDSLTPPKSPFMAHEDEKPTIICLENVPYFSCNERSKSYLKSRNFGMFLNLNLNWQSECIAVISKKYYCIHSALWINMPRLFADIKNNYFHVKALTMDSMDSGRNCDTMSVIQNLRTNICTEFLFLLKNLQTFYYEHSALDTSFLTNSEEFNQKTEVLTKLIKEIKTLLLLVGRIADINNIMQVKDFNERSKIMEYFHMCLDIWFNATTVLQMIYITPLSVEREIFCSDIDQFEPFLQVAMLILSDFIILAINHHESFSYFSNHSPFMCRCIQEFWSMLIIMLDKQMVSRDDSFWIVYGRIIQDLCKCISKTEPEEVSIYTFSLFPNQARCNNIPELCLWLTSHVSTLYKYDEWGNYYDFILPKSGYTVVKNLINLIISSKDTKEKNLCSALFYCTQMVMMWEPSCDIILPLTDFFIKKINETFLPGSEVNSLSFLHSNSFLWFENIINLSNVNATLGKESSFDLFLKLLCVTLTKTADENLWRCLKGRIYSKFMPKRIKEFSEIGLQNSFTLFLAIINAGHVEIKKEITDKICELASVIETVSSPRKQMISWKALFALVHIYQKKNWHLDNVVAKMTKYFNDACLNYDKVKKDSMHKNSIMNLLLVYIDSMCQIFEKCHNLSLNEYQLLDVKFFTLLSSCGISELTYILNAFRNILMKVQRAASMDNSSENTIEMQYLCLLKHIFAHVYPCIENFAVSNSPPVVISDIAALLTSLTHRFSSSILDLKVHEFSSLFLNFTCKEGVNALVICRFLCIILDDAALIDGLKSKVDFDTVVLQCWLKCIIYLTPPCTQMEELTSKIFMQSKIVELFPEVQNLNFRNGDHVYISIALFRCMGQHFENCKTLQEKSSLKLKVHQYFKMFVACVTGRIKKQCDVSTLSHVYKLTSHLVEYCSALLHIRFNPESILPQLLDHTVYPQLIFPKDKTLQSILSCSIKDYLPSFFHGLFKLNYLDDKCIAREIKNMIVTYIGSYSLSTNPVVKICIECAGKKPELLNFLLGIIKENVLSNHSGNKIGFQMCFEMLKVAPLAKKKEIAEVLLQCALEIYMQQTGSFSDFLHNLLLELCTYLKVKTGLNNSKIVLVPIFKWFIEEKLKWSAARGFTLIQHITDCIPDLLPDIISFLMKTITELEKIRGLGQDVLLREHLQQIIRKHEKMVSTKN